MKIPVFFFLLVFLQTSWGYSDILLSNLSPNQGITISSQISGGWFGSSVQKAGDFNGDGYDDIIIGSYGADKAYVIYGSASGLSNIDVSSGMAASQGMLINAEAIKDELGFSVSYAGDVNGDGIDDIIIGAYSARVRKGVVYVIYGSKNPPLKIDLSAGLNQSQGFIVIGDISGAYLGACVSYVGDVNNDKIDDIIIGASGAESNKGAYYVIFGKKGQRNQIDLASGLSLSEGFIIRGASANTYFGFGASAAGDIDGDGIGDIIIGAYAMNNKGIAYVIYGKNGGFGTIDLSQGLSQSEGFTITGSSGSQLGYSVRNAGDFNGDGKMDVIIGAQGDNALTGAAYVIFGMDRSTLLILSLGFIGK